MASKEKMGVAQLQTDAAKKKKELSDAERSQRLAERELKRVEQNLEDAKRDETRTRRIRRTQEELEDGMRRPCCWPGCKHRERTGK